MTGKDCLVLVILVIVVIGQHTQHQRIDNATQIDEGQLINEEIKYVDSILGQALSPWLKEEVQHFNQNNEFPSFQTFIFPLYPTQSYEFRWTPNLNQKSLKIMVSVFTQKDGSEFSYISNPGNDSFMLIERRSPLSGDYEQVGKVYISKVFVVEFVEKSLMIRVSSKHSERLAVQIDMEGNDLAIHPYVQLKNDHFTVPATKVEAIYAEMRLTETQRNRVYKWEWGFLEREEHYEEEMLKLTGVELLIILGTAIVQMYCIRNLFDRDGII